MVISLGLVTSSCLSFTGLFHLVPIVDRSFAMLHIVFVGSVTLVWFSLYRTAFTDPGFIKQSNSAGSGEDRGHVIVNIVDAEVQRMLLHEPLSGAGETQVHFKVLIYPSLNYLLGSN